MSAFVSSPSLVLAAVVLLSFLVTLVIRDDPAVILLVVALLYGLPCWRSPSCACRIGAGSD